MILVTRYFIILIALTSTRGGKLIANSEPPWPQPEAKAEPISLEIYYGPGCNVVVSTTRERGEGLRRTAVTMWGMRVEVKEC